VSEDKKILVNDSCILFDLIDLNLIENFFQLDFMVYTTQMVIEEIADDIQISEISKYISNGKLVIDDIDSFENIQLLFDKLSGLSFTDCSVLELAEREKGIIVSSDKGLRNEAQRRNLTVRGILWIIETLLKEEIITSEIALEKLKILPEINQRAPAKEISLLINKLKDTKRN
jgi:rRNA-processing protein FCF1